MGRRSEDLDAATIEGSRRELLPLVLALTLGLVAWVVCFASYPRVSRGTQEDLGNPAYWPFLLAAALMAGWLWPRRPARLGMASCYPVSFCRRGPHREPRGDEDGLWVLVIPMLFIFMLFAGLVARIAGWLHSRSRSGT